MATEASKVEGLNEISERKTSLIYHHLYSASRGDTQGAGRQVLKRIFGYTRQPTNRQILLPVHHQGSDLAHQ